ncbi:MAG: histone deacetylase [Actinomycetota bacterium]
MRAALITHPSSFDHAPRHTHPERPERVSAAVDGVREAGVDVVEIDAREASRGELSRVHAPTFLDEIKGLCACGGGSIDADTYVVAESWTAALFAAGAGLTAVEAIRRGDVDIGFAAVRPPGHHATKDRAMGFCLLNNVAVTAAVLAAEGRRVAVVDWDVHHGNGTQDIFYGTRDVLYLSLHHAPFYPGTGRVEEVGGGLGTGATVNIPLTAYSNGGVYRQAFERIVEPVLEQFDPDWILVSAGYDAHVDDPLGGMGLVPDDYAAMASSLSRTMDGTNTVFFLEGGYNLAAIRASVSATLDGFADDSRPLDPPPREVPAIDYAVEVFSLFWELDQG